MPPPPVIDQMQAYQKRAAAINLPTVDRSRRNEAARVMRQIAESADRDLESRMQRRLARRDFREPQTVEQCPVEHEMMFAAFLPFWRQTRAMGARATGWPAFGTARLGQTGALAWSDADGNHAVLFNPLSFEIAGFLGGGLAPFLRALREEEAADRTPRPPREIVLEHEDALNVLAEGVLQILRHGAGPGRGIGTAAADEALAYEAGGIASAILAFLMAHELGHIVGNHVDTPDRGPTFASVPEEILSLIPTPHDRDALETAWTAQENEIDADLLGIMVALAASGPADAAAGPLAWLLLMDILEYTVALVRYGGRATSNIPRDAHRAHAVAHGRDHPPPISRIDAIRRFAIEPLVVDDPAASATRQENNLRMRRRIDIVITVMGYLKSGLAGVVARPGQVELARVWQHRPEGAIYPAF